MACRSCSEKRKKTQKATTVFKAKISDLIERMKQQEIKEQTMAKKKSSNAEEVVKSDDEVYVFPVFGKREYNPAKPHGCSMTR